MNIPINQRDKFSPLPKNEPKPNAFSANAFNPQETNISDLKTPIKELYTKWSPFIHFILWMLTMAIIASYGFDSKYGKLIEALNRREDQMKQMEYNTSIIKDKISENAIIRNQVLSDNQMMVEAIKETMKVREAKIINN